MKQIIYLYITLVMPFWSAAQPATEWRKDSLWKQVQTGVKDTHMVQTLLHYGELFEVSRPDTAMFYYNQARELSEKLQYKKGLSAYTSYTIVVLNNLGKFEEALALCQKNIQRWEGSGNKQELAVAYINAGSEWQYLSDLETAATYYIKALEYAEQINNLPYQRVATNNLASIFNSLQQYNKALLYAHQSLQIAKALQNDYAIASSLINIGTSHTHLKNTDSALTLFKQVEAIGHKISDDILVMDGWLGMADNYAAMQQYTIADGWYKKIIERAKTTGTPEYQLYAYMGLSDVMLKTKQYKEGKKHINNGIELAQQLGTRLELKNLYLRAAELYEATGNTGEALRWHKQFVALNDSLLNEKNTSNINALEIKYESTKKESQIKQLQSEKKVQQLVIKQKNTVNAILLLVGCSLLAIGWLMYKSHQQKQQLQLGRIAELEKEKKLLATEAMLKGQEEERSRLAKDLHDGLGGMLSGVKFSFSNMKENLIMTPENLQVFQRGLDMLDSSISEMRRVAHSMMPEALLKFGLDAALRDFCTQINSSGVIKILYQSYALEDLQINQTSSVTIYRIVQELINNSIKHSGASQAIVQLNREQNKLLLTVEDNGTGFHKEQLNKSAGVGWANISSRLAYLNASVDLESAPGKGTSVNIEIDIEP